LCGWILGESSFHAWPGSSWASPNGPIAQATIFYASFVGFIASLFASLPSLFVELVLVGDKSLLFSGAVWSAAARLLAGGLIAGGLIAIHGSAVSGMFLLLAAAWYLVMIAITLLSSRRKASSRIAST